jgi:hypothetical protein
MTRIESLEAVLVAAQAVLEARENQMLTHVEWDALASAVKSARAEDGPVSKRRVQVVFEDGLMLIMDLEHQGYDCLDLGDCRLEEAAAQIDRWAREYAFDVDRAKRGLAAYFPEL